jgi:hypothetical protein
MRYEIGGGGKRPADRNRSVGAFPADQVRRRLRPDCPTAAARFVSPFWGITTHAASRKGTGPAASRTRCDGDIGTA